MNYHHSDSSNNKTKDSFSFEKLDPKIQKWIWMQKWDELRDIQEKAIPLILTCKSDIIISSPTASGKTEAAFLPIFTKLLQQPSHSIQALYISPLKALINDQFERLYPLSEALGIEIFKWHGDVSYSKKRKLMESPSGVLQITPESLESLLINHFTKIEYLFGELNYIVVDELHYFLGSERGKQLQSLLYRIEIILKRIIPRIGLSATIGDIKIVEKFLRPKANYPLCYITCGNKEQETKLQIRGYSLSDNEYELNTGNTTFPKTTLEKICLHLFNNIRGKTNLVFANSRANVETYSDSLRLLASYNNLPNEFFPHHGSLSRQIREQVENKLKDKRHPTTAICTSTLELGIDVGTVHSIAQIGVPPSVSSVRQRLGRSGRRGEPSILRIYIEERELTASSPIADRLRSELFQTIAIINLLIKKWYEPQDDNHLHLSTLFHQILSLVAQYGGIGIKSLYEILIESGSFGNVDKDIFMKLLKRMNIERIIEQTNDGTIVIGINGERLVNHYEYYSVFKTPDEYKLLSDKNILGSLPIVQPLKKGMALIFAGKRWEIIDVNDKKRTIYLKPAPGGRPPKFSGSGWILDGKIREEMYNNYKLGRIPPFLDDVAQSMYREGLEHFQLLSLSDHSIVMDGKDALIFLWSGDVIFNTLMLMIQAKGHIVSNEGICLRIESLDILGTKKVLTDIFQDNSISELELASIVKNKYSQKFDVFLSEELLNIEYSAGYLDIRNTKEILHNSGSIIKRLPLAGP